MTTKAKQEKEEKEDLLEQLGQKLAKSKSYFKMSTLSNVKCLCSVNVVFEADYFNDSIGIRAYDESHIMTDLLKRKPILDKIKEIKTMKAKVKLIAEKNNLDPNKLWDEYVYWSE